MKIEKKCTYEDNVKENCAECGFFMGNCYEISTSDSYYKICLCEDCFHKLATAMNSVNEFTTLLKFK